jgi:hypothetical protein
MAWTIGVGCGSSRDLGPDAAGAHDALQHDAFAPGDAEPPDGGPYAPVHVKVYDHDHPGFPNANARVVFEGPDHNAQTVMTDASGIAIAMTPPDSIVTVLQDSIRVSSVIFSSFQSVQPGDSLTAGPRKPEFDVVGSIAINLPQDPNAKYYTVTASCPFVGAVPDVAVPNHLKFYLEAPCEHPNSATLVGKIYDTNNVQYAESLLGGVDLVAAVGGTLTMPPYTLVQQAVTANLTNIPTTTEATEWFATYHTDNNLASLEDDGANAVATGSFNMSTLAYPVGDQTVFTVLMLEADLHGPFREYHEYQSGHALNFAFDGGNPIAAVEGTSVSTHAISWTQSPTGRLPMTVVVEAQWQAVRGVIYAPYANTSISLMDLPAQLLPDVAPNLVSVQYFDAPGSSYAAVVARLDQSPILAAPFVTLPMTDTYWTSTFPVDYLMP